MVRTFGTRLYVHSHAHKISRELDTGENQKVPEICRRSVRLSVRFYLRAPKISRRPVPGPWFKTKREFVFIFYKRAHTTHTTKPPCPMSLVE